MAKKMEKMGKGADPANMRSKPNPPLRKGTGTLNMAKAMIKGKSSKKGKSEY